MIELMCPNKLMLTKSRNHWFARAYYLSLILLSGNKFQVSARVCNACHDLM